jgi:acetyl esterase/lipase
LLRDCSTERQTLDIPIGHLIGVIVFGAIVCLTLVAPRRPRVLASLAYRVASVYNEAPFPFIYLLLFSWIGPITDDQLQSFAGRALAAVELLVIFGFGLIAWQGTRARTVVGNALSEGLGAGWRAATDRTLVVDIRRRPPIARILLMPFVMRPRAVERIGNISYGEFGRHNLLDLYRHRSRPEGAPVLVYFHGGGFYGGRKSVEGRALLFRLASQGWVTVSANYRLRPRASFLEHMTDVKRVVAWVREHGPDFGADPSTLFLSGGSAGGTLCSIAAMTQNDPRYQPGFEDADTSVTAVASLYGWYGGYYELGGPDSAVGVLGHDALQAPPLFIAHGSKDSLAWVETARRFAAHLRSNSPNPVVYAELPHGQHAFDLFHSFRFSAVVDGIEAFAAWVRSSDQIEFRRS